MIDPKAVLKKTEKGEEEIRTRRYGLSMHLRAVLILIDGVSSFEKITAKAYGMKDIESDIQTLMDEGYIVSEGSEQKTVTSAAGAKEKLIGIVNEIFGDKSEKILSRIDSVADEPEALRAALSSAVKLAKLTIDEEKARELKERGEAILGG